MPRIALVWLRRDLRLFDQAAISVALQNADQVLIAFVFDTTILKKLPKQDRRIEFIHLSLQEIKKGLREYQSDLLVCHGDPLIEIPKLVVKFGINDVYTNHDYEPEAILRDEKIKALLLDLNISFHTFKDQVVFEKYEILTQAHQPYTVFTPYKRNWLSKLTDEMLQTYPVKEYCHKFNKIPVQNLPSLKELGFEKTNLTELKMPIGMSGAEKLFEDFKNRITRYHELRDFPAIKGVSYLSTHLRFGTVSIRELVRYAHFEGSIGAQAWLSELIWREFYQQLLFHHPYVTKRAFKVEYDELSFDNNPVLFKAWCEGQTGYPLVDAAMRQLNQTGFMHNRLRMVTASFLVKDLLIDWHWGEAYFAEKLLDFDLASNNGGWQWAASTGCDAQPYMRIFNPITQSKRFDAEAKFIRRYCPELNQVDNKLIHGLNLNGIDYPKPIVDHAIQRQLALELYRTSLKVNH